MEYEILELVRKIVVNFSKPATGNVVWVLHRLHFDLTLKELLDTLQPKKQVEAGFSWSETQILQFLKIP